MYNICVIGLGYVGLVSAVKLALDGNNVFGIEIDKLKFNLLQKGQMHFHEPGLGQAFKKVLKSKKLKIYDSIQKVSVKPNIFMICVGTPSDKKGDFDFSILNKSCESILGTLGSLKQYFVVVIRSTTLPGKTKEIFIDKVSKNLNLTIGIDFDVVMNPEFLREGSAINDYDNAARTVLGTTSDKSADILKKVYKNVKAPVFITDLETAELCKYIDNTWHALKIVFGNEIGAISKKLEVDIHKLHEIFISDKKLNISSAYLKPGFAFGGSCLPKDVKALISLSKINKLNLPTINSIISSNDKQIVRALNLILKMNKKKICFLGLSFKKNTDDCRESPTIRLINNLLNKGKFKIFVYDKLLQKNNYSSLKLKNVIFNENAATCIKESELIVISHADTIYINNIIKNGKSIDVIDLVGIPELKTNDNYISLN